MRGLTLSKETCKVKLLEKVGELGTPKAYQFHHPDTHKDVWIPRSLVEHVSRSGLRDKEGFRSVVVEVEEWFIEKEGL